MHLFDCSCFKDFFGVIGVWSSEIVMMSGSLSVDSYCISGDVHVDTSSVPWIIVTIEEDNISIVVEVLAWLSTTEEVKSPVVLRSESVGLLAVLGVTSFIPVVPSVGTLSRVITLWHWELTTGLNSPSTVIQSN